MRLLGEELDVTFIVKCSDADFIRTALLPEIMQKFFIVFQQHNAKGTIQLKGDELYYEERGRIGSHAIRARFLALIHALKRGDSSG
jgi:hypothetical protein